MVSIREFVAHLPPDKRELLAAPARLLPVKSRYGPIYQRTIREIEKGRTTPSWVLDTVDERLTETFRTAREAPYYTRGGHYDVLDRVTSGDVSTRDALSELPILTREDLSEHYRDMLAAPEKTVELSASSGTSGDPIFFLLDRNRGAREWAYVVDSWSSTGYQLGQWRVFFRGLDLPQHRPYFVMNSTGEIVIRIQTISPETVRECWELIEKRGIKYLHGYPSTFMYLARLLEDADFDTSWRFKIRGVMPVSEQYGPEQRDVLQRLFPNAKQAVFYGLSEKSVFAWLDDDFVYHPYPLYGHVELLNEDGTTVDVGERGRIVTTTLDGRGMPLVRYDTGDSAELIGHDEVGTPLFKNVLARRGREGLIKVDGKTFSTTPFNVHGHEFECVHRFKIRQDTPGKAVLLVQPSQKATEEDLEQFRQLMIRRTENQVELDFELVDELPATMNGKFTLLDQRIPNAPTAWA
ncbi:phenylacetate--CoA ligase family protein [Kocuria carniphila]|uniref:phenylacetate--CoA ligase family protein n=1 Tax=Kocuria carniphila TaxID=262208 RepID=UPI0034CE0D1A